MKNMKAIGLLVLALITGLAAAVFAANWLSQRGTIAATRVAVAAVDIELGSKIDAQMLTLVDWPAGSVPEGAFNEVKNLQDRVAKVGVQRGEALLERKLSPVGTKGGLSAVIAEGKRAMTVRVNDVVGVAGFALPGNYVDVMVNTQQKSAPGQSQNQISMTVLEKVLVLAVAQEAGRDDNKPKVVSAVTLELAPADAEKLDLARSVGTLSLVLRNQLDKKTVATAGITREQLLGLKETPEKPAVVAVRQAAPRPAPRPVLAAAQCVEVIRNGTQAMNCF
jgi:pilus assembly protein CpaB